MKKHPLLTYVFVYTCDFVALIVFIISLLKMPYGVYSEKTWLDFLLALIIVVVARNGIEIIGLRVTVGLQSVFEIVTLFILPFPLFCIVVCISFCINVIKRIISKHPEPFLGPDFNASNTIMSGLSSALVLSILLNLFSNSLFGATLSYLLAALVYSVVNILLLSLLLMIDTKKPLRQVGSLDTDALVSEGLMVTVGALIGRIYLLDPSLIILFLLPIFFLQKTLQRINEAKYANLDSKTGLYNYRFYDESFRKLFEEAKRTKSKLSLVFGDMDYLRDINNTYGHLVGDEALITVAKVFKNIRIPEAIASRFGGEEFVLILPGYDKYIATKIAEEIRSSVEQSKIRLENGNELSITISLGVAAFPDDAMTMNDLVSAADESLYAAKHSGRNRVCTYGDIKSG